MENNDQQFDPITESFSKYLNGVTSIYTPSDRCKRIGFTRSVVVEQGNLKIRLNPFIELSPKWQHYREGTDGFSVEIETRHLEFTQEPFGMLRCRGTNPTVPELTFWPLSLIPAGWQEPTVPNLLSIQRGGRGRKK